LISFNLRISAKVDEDRWSELDLKWARQDERVRKLLGLPEQEGA
jgi:hypothetical protein